MTKGIGGGTIDGELNRLKGLVEDHPKIPKQEYEQRLTALRSLMIEQDVPFVFLHAGTNLFYFTGLRWRPSERMVGAVITSGDVDYILPFFERATIQTLLVIDGNLNTWHEHENPVTLLNDIVNAKPQTGTLALDDSMTYGMGLEITQSVPTRTVISASSLSSPLRASKTELELSSLKRAKKMTLEVQRSAARILKDGISTVEVTDFIHDAHKAIGAGGGSFFCIVLFGEASSHPHGVNYTQYLEPGDMVLIDTGCEINSYKSDITRSYVYGTPTDRQREIWNVEKEAQIAGFNAAQLSKPCEEVDVAARSIIVSHGFGPNYDLPGLPHRTGHGIGLDIHEGPYLVKGDTTNLAVGMCFSNEPMMVVPGEFGVRLEDHFYMTTNGPVWFTEPSHSIDDPFGNC